MGMKWVDTTLFMKWLDKFGFISVKGVMVNCENWMVSTQHWFLIITHTHTVMEPR